MQIQADCMLIQIANHCSLLIFMKITHSCSVLFCASNSQLLGSSALLLKCHVGPVVSTPRTFEA